MDPMLPQSSGVWAAIGSAVLLFIGGSYKAFRMIKGDLRDDRATSSLDKLNERQSAKLKETEDRLQKVQDERIVSVELTGKLKGEIISLTTRIEDLRENKDNEIARLREDISELKDENHKLKETNEKLIISGGFNRNYTDNSDKK